MKEVTVGIDIGGTNSVLGIVEKNGNILAENKILTTDYPVINDFVLALHRCIQETVSGIENISIKAIGIGAPNGNYYNGTIEYAPNLAWKGIVPLCEMFKEYYKEPVVLTNDANAAAMGEMIYGGARGMNNFIMITLGTGLGSGIVVNGEVLYGSTGFAGEIGHTIVDPNGRDCGCGRKGCLENYASATGICRTFLELLGIRRDKSDLRTIGFEDLTSIMITREAEKGDKVALEAFDITAKWLSLALVNSVAFSSPEAFFLFGGLANAGEYIFKPVQKYFDQNVQRIFKDTVKILPSEIKESNAAVLGASALAWNELAN
jgi:glucokinase